MSDKPLTIPVPSALVNNAPFVVSSLLLIDSLHFVFARLLVPYLPPTTAAMYVLLVATSEMVVVSILWSPVRLVVFRRYIWFFLSIGFLAATSTVINYAAVAFVDPGTASLLAKTSILFGVVLGLIWLRERLLTLEWIGGAVAIVGVFIITFQPGDYFRLGSVMVLGSALMYALHAALVKRRVADLNIAEFFLFRLACTAGFLFLFTLGQGTLVWPSGPAWMILLMNGTVGAMVGRALYYLALRRLKLTVHSIVLTLSPVVTIGWTVLLFGIVPTAQQLIGGVAVIGGVLMVTVGRLKSG
jgi:drug/metabolite transporter (DMT)-like permease